MAVKKYIKSQVVVAGTDIADGYIPANDEKIIVAVFHGQPPSSSKADVRLVWDFEGASEELLWSIQENGPMPDVVFFEKTGDGSKKMALCLANGCSADYTISGVMVVEGDDVS